MENVPRLRRIAGLLTVIPALLIVLAACGSASISADEVASKAESALGEKIGNKPEVECPEDLPAEKGKSQTCTLTDPDSGKKYDMTAKVTEVDGDRYRLGFEVAGQSSG